MGNTYYWRGNVNTDIGNINNYATTAAGTTVPTTILPGDLIMKATTVTNAPGMGTSVANWNYQGTGAAVNGGTFNGDFVTASPITFGGVVTFNGRFSLDNGVHYFAAAGAGAMSKAVDPNAFYKLSLGGTPTPLVDSPGPTMAQYQAGG